MRTKLEIIQGNEQAFIIRCSLDFAFFCINVLGYTMKPFHLEWCDMLKRSYLIAILAPTGFGKCFAAGTELLMYDCTVKNVESIKEGDLLMGDDSGPREVRNIIHGRDDMYGVWQKNGNDYVVNKAHIFSLKMNCDVDGYKKGDLVDIEVKDYLNKSKTFKHCAKGYKVPLSFEEQELTLEPYFLGLWLGDGNKRDQVITNKDTKIIEYMSSYAKKLNMKLTMSKSTTRCPTHSIISGKNKSNIVLGHLRELDLLHNKHIPTIYKRNSRENRLQLLAGLIDSDGHAVKNVISIIQKDFKLTRDIIFLARSLGFRVSSKAKQKQIKSIGFEGTYYETIISGNTDQIPVKLARKRCSPRKINKNPLNTGVKVEYVGEGDYFGFEVVGKNRRFLMDDLTVVHNTWIFGKAYPLWLSIFKPGSQSIIVSKVVKGQSASIMEDIKYVIEDNEFLKEHLAPDSSLVRTWTKERIVCANNSKIFNSPYSPSIRGAHVDYIFGDEVAVYPDKSDHYLIWFRDVMTRVADAKHGRVAAVSTPVEPGDLSVVLVNNKMFDSKSYPAIVNYTGNDYTTGESIWPERFSIKKLMELKEIHGPANFERNYMCNSEADVAGSIFKLKHLFGLLNYNLSFTSEISDQDSFVFIGCDFAMSDGPQADFDAYVVIEKTTQGKMIIKHIETWKGLSMDEKMVRLLELGKTYRPYQFLCDKSNVGQDIVLKLIQNGWSAEAVAFGSLSRGVMLGNLKSVIENKLLVIPYNETVPEEQFIINDLFDQLIGFREDKTEKTRITTIVSRATHDDIAMALALAVKGAAEQDIGGGDILLSA